MIYTSSYIGVIISAIVCFVIGFIWFGPLFGKKWMALMKFTPEQMEEGKKKGWAKQAVISIVFSLVTAFVFFTLADALFAVGVTSVFCLAILLWLGFSVPIFLNGVLWEGKSWNLFWLNSLHILVTLIATALIYNWMA